MTRNARFGGFDHERLETPLPATVAIAADRDRTDALFLLIAILVTLTMLAITQPYIP